MDLIEAIKGRRTIRRFLEKEVDLSLVKQLITLGTYAPSACNRQAWRFIIVTDKEIMKMLRKYNASWVIPNSPVGILVVYNKFTVNMKYPDNIESASACIENILLGATSFGVGACWINDLPSKKIIRKLLC